MAEWRWQQFDQDGFKVLAPVTLTLERRALPGEGYITDFHQYRGGSMADTAESMTFIVDHYSTPDLAGTMDRAFADTLLQASVDELIRAIGGTSVYSESALHAGHPARQWKASFQDGKGVVRGKCILAGGAYYGLQVFGLSARQPEESMNRFLNSFHLLEPENHR